MYDVIIVGGGINGVGIVRDASMRGLKCLLLEKNDFSAGTSGGSSGMIHGGPRYMLGDIEVTKLACLDSGFIQKVAPHLLFRIPFLYPVYVHENQTLWQAQLHLEAVESFFTAYDKFVPLKNGKPHTRLSKDDVLKIEPHLPPHNLLGAVTFDEWGIDVPRLCIANVLSAEQYGARILNHTEVIKVNCVDQRFESVTFKNKLTNETETAQGRYLVNATGPWAMSFAKKMGLSVKLRPGKGIHLVYDRRLFNMAIVTQALDGREMFIMPYENTTIVATTDDDYFGDLDDQVVTQDEIHYLEEAIIKIFPQIKNSRLIYAYSGVRPTLYERLKSESSLSREHEIIDHGQTDQAHNIFTLTGGKLASYRIIAEEVVNLVAQRLGNTTPCRTHTEFLFGGTDDRLDADELAEKYGVDVFSVLRLIYRHGAKAIDILEKTRAHPHLKNFICSCEPVMACEFEYVIETEKAKTLADIKRRTRWTQGPCQGTQCFIAGSVCALKQNASQKSFLHNLNEFQDEVWYNRGAVASGVQMKQEELQQALLYGNANIPLRERRGDEKS